MACDSCTPTLPIALCGTILQIGQTKFLSTAVFVFIQSLTNDFIWRETETTDASGVLTLDLSNNQDQFSTNYEYIIFATLNDTSTGERIFIEVGNTEFTCFELNIDRIEDDNGVNTVYALQVLELNETFTAVVPFFDFDGRRKVIQQGGTSDVERWINLGSDDDASQSVVASRPIYAAPDLVFQPSEFLIIPSPTYSKNDYLHIMVLLKSGEGANQVFTQWDDTTVADRRFFMQISPGTFFPIAGIANSGSLAQVLTIETAVNDVVHLIEMIYDGENLEMFLDGLRVLNKNIQDDGEIPSLQVVTNRVLIGAVDILGIAGNEFTGDLRHIKMFETQLSATEHQQQRLLLLSEI